jgi:hypothetical protein
MLTFLNRRTAIGFWLAIVASIAALGAWWGVPLSAGSASLMLIAGVVPSVMVLVVWRGAPPPTAAEILHAAEERR